jgi:hypothetical protein
LPMTATGKVLKRELRAASAAAGTAGPAGVPGASLPTPAEAMTARA